MIRLPAIILAGGRATRMGGGDKPLRMIGGKTMLAVVIERISAQCAPLCLNANGDPQRFAGYGLPVLADSLPDHPGPLAGILAGMDWAAGLGAASVISVAGDTPFFPVDLAERLQLAAGASGLAIAAGRDDAGVTDHPTFGLWPVALREDLRSRLAAGQRRVRSFSEAHSPGIAVWDASPVDPFFNVNTPEDLMMAETIARNLR